ncbi:DNA starvation/stationary phase protection protein [Sporosarcina sp. P37]|uniref:Dps family protein n=1 Tax=unclassified Sporosarcina TaxID=2647733 RepID=UPI0009BDBEA2|nr:MULTISPECIES: DNA starvation/stationary phase protection protein [unclassified Sporosarcina]ARD47407.1 DNA starvation/stationary phase protection protein [Sporosarcina sp. P33]ARK23976.1 DNA starvation/stationary phase protection protein [Sporosarcina sp. P37]PID16284.1 DNA starvation/stationary phase protection protein [Sporosarcina sp. P35]
MSKELIQELNKQVSTWSVLYAKLHNYHWYVKGNQFFTLHAKFEELYNEATVHMDEIAERVLTLGGEPTATLAQHLNESVVDEAKGTEKANDMVQTLVDDFDKTMKSLKKAMEFASKDSDDRTEDMLNAIYQSVEKHQWMLNAFLGETNE